MIDRKKITLGFILGWLLSLIFLIVTVSQFVDGNILTSLIAFVMFGITSPPICDYLHENTGYSLSGGLKVVAVVILFYFLGATMDYETPSKAINNYSSADVRPINRVNKLEVKSYNLVPDEYGKLIIVGEAVNNSDREIPYAQVMFNLYDVSDAQIGSAFDNITNLEPGKTWRFRALVPHDETATAKLKSITDF